jgi:hypothetical protein
LKWRNLLQLEELLDVIHAEQMLVEMQLEMMLVCVYLQKQLQQILLLANTNKTNKDNIPCMLFTIAD